MAKRLTAFVVDVGPGMRESEPGAELGDPTPLEKTVSDLATVLQRKIFSEEGKAASTKSEVCLVLFGTDETENPLAEDGDGYFRNVTLSRRMSPATWELVDHVVNQLPLSETNGDFLEAIVVAVDHLREVMTTSKQKQHACDVVVFSNLKAHFGDSQIDDVVKGLTKMDVELKIIGPQFDGQDDSQGTKHERKKLKTDEQKENEELIHTMLRRGVAGGVYSFEDMASVISSFQSRMKAARPVHYTLAIGNSFSIPVSLFTLVAKTRANDGRPWKDFYAKDPEKPVQKEVSHVLDNETRDEVTKEERVRMWAYGSRLIPLTDEELKAMAFKAGVKEISLLGFTSLDDGKTRVPPFLWTGDSVKVMLPRKDDEVASRCYKSLLRSMIDQNVAMILRFVYQANSQPRLVLGVPAVRHSTEIDPSAPESEVELLQIVTCPFAEDLRDFQFPSLEGERWKPSEEEENIVDGLIDGLYLDEEGEDESFEPESTLNPYLQRLYRCLSHRALRPDAPLPAFKEEQEDSRRGISLAPRAETLTSSSVQNALAKVKSTFGLKKVVKKKMKRRGDDVFNDGEAEEAEEEESAKKKRKIDERRIDDVSDLVGGGGVGITAVGDRDPVADFDVLISRPDTTPSDVDFFLKQLLDVGFSLVLSSPHSRVRSRALASLSRARLASIDARLHAVFNEFMKKLKTRSRGEGVGDFWTMVEEEAKKGTSLDLISTSDVPSSDVDFADAKGIFETESSAQKTIDKTQEEDEEDLFDMM